MKRTIALRQSLLPILTLALILLPSVVFGAEGPTHALQPIEDTKAMIADVAYYAKYLLPGIALAYVLYGATLKSAAGSDEHKKMKAESTITNAKWGLVLGLVAAPLCAWIQLYYTH